MNIPRARGMGRRLLWSSVVVALLFFGPRQARAQEGPDELWGFAGQLYEQGDFYRAVGEYERFRFLFPDDPRAVEAELQIGRCYRLGGDVDKAFSSFLALSQREPGRPEGRTALLEMIAMLEAQRRYREAVYWGERFVALYPDEPECEAVLVRLAWLYMDTGDYRQAVATLEKIPPGSLRYATARSLIRVLEERPYQAPKSPEVAGTLAALLPGAGHLYVGRPAQAATSFLLNGLFVWGAVAAFTHDSPVLGGILLFFELGWYQGGIRSAAAAAQEVNADEERRYRQELRRDYRLSFGVFPGRDQVLFAVRLDL
jgi:tetratricopeptide (TPR) repeat protein